jgi:acetolactate synthase I/II/III large subunit
VRVVDGIAAILKREGVQYVFCYPQNSLIEACAAAGIRPIVCRQERAGAGMADGYSRVTNGQPVGVFTSQAGPGGENAFAAVATAFSDSTPMLFLPHGDNSDRFGIPKVFSPIRSFETVTKSTQLLNQPERAGEIMRRAFTGLRLGRPGPVLVEIPNDVAEQEVDEARLAYKPVKPARTAADPAGIDQAARMLLQSHTPVIFAGQGVTYAGAADELARLAELIQAPVMTSLLGKGAFAEDHPLSAGTAAGVGPGTVPHCLDKADVILAVGTSLTRHGISSATLPDGKVIIQAVNDPVDVNKDYSIDHVLLGDAKLVLAQLCEAVMDRQPPRREGAVAEELSAVRQEWLSQWLPKLTSNETPINPYRIVWELTNQVDPARAIVTHDSGSPRNQLVPFYRTAPGGYIGFGKAHALGSSLGLIMGAKLAAPDKLCVNFMGDSAFGMIGTDFETAVRNGIPILSLVSNNFEMAAETARMAVSHGRYETRKTGGNYADMAKAMGGYAERIEDPNDVAAAIRRGIQATEDGKAALIEFITSPETASSSTSRRAH